MRSADSEGVEEGARTADMTNPGHKLFTREVRCGVSHFPTVPRIPNLC